MESGSSSHSEKKRSRSNSESAKVRELESQLRESKLKEEALRKQLKLKEGRVSRNFSRNTPPVRQESEQMTRVDTRANARYGPTFPYDRWH